MPTARTRARALFPTLLGLGVVLLVMAVVLSFYWLNGPGDISVCASADPGATRGDCLLSIQLDRQRTELLRTGTATLFAGGVAAMVVGLAQLIWDRRR